MSIFMPGIICASAPVGSNAATAQPAIIIDRVIVGPHEQESKAGTWPAGSGFRARRGQSGRRARSRVERRGNDAPWRCCGCQRRGYAARGKARGRDAADAHVRDSRVVVADRRGVTGMMHRRGLWRGRVMARRARERREGKGCQEQRKDQPSEHGNSATPCPPERQDQTLKRKFSTSPSWTTYSLPSWRSLPASRAPVSPPSAT